MKGKSTKRTAVKVADDVQEPSLKKRRGRSGAATDSPIPASKDGKNLDNSDGVLPVVKQENVQVESNGNSSESSAMPNKKTVNKRGKKTAEPIKVKDEPVDNDASLLDAPSNSGVQRNRRSNRGAAAKANHSMKLMNDEETDEVLTTNGSESKAQNKNGSAGKVKKEKKSATKEKLANKGKSAPKNENEQSKKSGVERKLVKKGRAAVDSHCPVAASSHVLEEGDDIWDCMLNQTNIQFNNNKYYIIQLLENDSAHVYSVWMRWGRVGANGQNCLKPCGANLQQAKQIFEKKFDDKTRNDWDDRENFEKVPGKYDLVHLDYSDDRDENPKDEVDGMKQPKKELVCHLEKGVKALVELICNITIMKASVMEMKYDADKAPLGKLTKEQIKAGYLALLDISNIVNQGSGKVNDRALLSACNNFYTRIPHYFGMKVPPMIRTSSEVREKLQLLEALGDIQAALSFINSGDLNSDVHPVDRHYSGLQCDIKTLSPEDEAFKLICKYVTLNHGKTHSSYTLAVENVFECIKSSEQSRFLKSVGNRMLLWHGSRLSNWAGILSQGLRIAPPEAPVTGYMFGKGIYFADMCSKSANYCMASCSNSTGLLTLCEVALGTTNDLLAANYKADQLPSGCNSVKGVGSMAPNPKTYATMDDGVVVPLGPADQVRGAHSLLYNEFIVYNPAQVRIRYLVKVKFNFNL